MHTIGGSPPCIGLRSFIVRCPKIFARPCGFVLALLLGASGWFEYTPLSCALRFGESCDGGPKPALFGWNMLDVGVTCPDIEFAPANALFTLAPPRLFSAELARLRGGCWKFRLAIWVVWKHTHQSFSDWIDCRQENCTFFCFYIWLLLRSLRWLRCAKAQFHKTGNVLYSLSSSICFVIEPLNNWGFEIVKSLAVRTIRKHKLRMIHTIDEFSINAAKMFSLKWKKKQKTKSDECCSGASHQIQYKQRSAELSESKSILFDWDWLDQFTRVSFIIRLIYCAILAHHIIIFHLPPKMCTKLKQAQYSYSHCSTCRPSTSLVQLIMLGPLMTKFRIVFRSVVPVISIKNKNSLCRSITLLNNVDDKFNTQSHTNTQRDEQTKRDRLIHTQLPVELYSTWMKIVITCIRRLSMRSIHSIFFCKH